MACADGELRGIGDLLSRNVTREGNAFINFLKDLEKIFLKDLEKKT